MESWKAISETNGMIEVSDHGRFRSFLSGKPRVLTAHPDKNGYLRICVEMNHSRKTYKVHREVAKAFIENPKGLAEVNHIDGDKSNNVVSNLEWMSHKENIHHAIATGLRKPQLEYNKKTRVPIIATNLETGEVIEFESITSAKRTIRSNHIQEVLRGDRYQCKGYTFCYAKGVV